MTNIYEQASRLKKAAALVALLRQHRVGISEVERMGDWHWGQLARVAKVNAPSPETRKLVLEQLKAGEPK